MFNLEEAIAGWRKKTQAAAKLEDGNAEELESHLRDLIAAKMESGQAPEEAFKNAVKEIGRADELENQFTLARERESWRAARTVLPGLMVSYLKVMVRQFRRYGMHNWVTISGLSIGLASCLFIALYALHELSFDKDYEGRLIYRVSNKQISETGVEEKDSGGPVPLGKALMEDFSEVKNSVRFWRAYRPVVRHGENLFIEERFIFTDSTVFDMFGFKLVKGNPADVLKSPNTIVITEETARKYFGGDDPIGKVIEYNGYPQGKLSFTVTGVLKDLPDNSHFDFDLLASIQTVSREADNWGSFKSLWTYVEVASPSAKADLEAKFDAFETKYMGDRKENREGFGLFLEEVSSIYLHSAAGRSMKPGGSMPMIRIVILTGILILIMSCVNFINISLAKMSVRMKEVGVRKVLGAMRGQLAFQFVSEVVVSFLISLVLALGLIFLLTPVFTSITGVRLQPTLFLNLQFGVVLLGIFIFVVALAGYAPSSRLSSFSPTEAFKLKPARATSSVFSFRNALIFVQLAISGILIMSVMVMRDQLSFISKKDLGIRIDNVVAIPYSETPDAFENKVRSMASVESFGYSQRLPVNTLNYDGRVVRIPGIEDPISVESCFITPDFLDTYNVKLLAGRNLRAGAAADSNKFIINETALKAFGWTMEDAIGGALEWSGSLPGEVIGVVSDFHLESVHEKIPAMIMLNGEGTGKFQRTFMSLRIEPSHMAETLLELEREWRALNPNGVFFSVRMNDSFDQLHANDQIFSKIIFYFMLIAIFISGIGLYAVSSYTAEQRRKEIGIRKVLGSSIGGITYKLAAPYLYISMIALVLVVTVVYYAMTQWLMTFAYHVSVQWATLAVGGVLIIVLTFASVLIESVRAATVNPIKFLREE